MTLHTRSSHGGRRAQRGSVLIYTAIFLSLGVILLVGLELGHLYYVKRELQKAADLSAMAAVKEIVPTNCGPATTAGTANAAANLAGGLDGVEPEFICGRWDPAIDNALHFNAGQTDFNAVRVVLTRTPDAMLPFFPGSRTVAVQAVAMSSDPVAAFSVGTRLLRLEAGGLLPNLLATVGVGLTLGDILSYQGLANARVKPSGLLSALGVPLSGDVDVGTLNATAQLANLTLGQLLNASLTALQQQQGDAVAAEIALLTHLVSHLRLETLDTAVQLLGNAATQGLLVGLDTTGRAALEADVNLLDLVSAGLVAANGANFIGLPSLSVPLLGVTARASVVEPPAIGIGGVGTQARSAQVRVYLRINSNGVPVVGAVLGLLGTGLDLPVIVEVAQATGTLASLDCAAAEQNASVDVTASLVNLCVGRFHNMTSVADAADANFFVAANSCRAGVGGVIPDTADGVRRHRVLSVLGILPLTARVGLPVFSSQQPLNTGLLYEPTTPRQTPDTSVATVSLTGFDLAQTARNLANTVAVGLLGDLAGTGITADAATRQSMAASLVGTGNGGYGRTITTVGNEMRWSQQSLEALNTQVVAGGLGGLLGGLLNGVGMTLNTLLIDPVADVVCSLGLTANAVRTCRTNYIRDSTLAAGNNLLSSTLSMAIALISPLLDPLSAVFEALLARLGISLGQTDVSLLSVGCGRPGMVY